MPTPNNTQQNILTAMQSNAIALLELRNKLALLVQMWSNESMTSLSDADIQALVNFSGVTQVEALAAKQAFDAVLASLGDPGTVGTNAFKLLKLANRVP